MIDELSSFIGVVYKEPYALLGNNCLNKPLRIKAKAEGLVRRADLILGVRKCAVRIVSRR